MLGLTLRFREENLKMTLTCTLDTDQAAMVRNVHKNINSLLFQSELDYPLEALRQDLVPALQMTEYLLVANEL